MADGKWITEVTADTPLADAARWVLAVRLEVVRDHLQLALREPGKDIEHVHQLRVGTRRAGAAVEIFRLCLPDKVYKSARKQLRRIRRAAGAARDWDVFLAALTAEKRAEAAPAQAGVDLLIGYALAQRVTAQEHLEALCPDYPFDFERLRAEAVAAVRPPRSDGGPRTLADLARPLLADLLRELDAAAARDLDDYDNLHQVRIAGKRLRYAMEVFANCFAPAFREELYPLVEEMQEVLGRANDSHVAAGRLRGLREQLRGNRLVDRKRFEPGLRRLLLMHERRLPQERRRFKEWWQRWQQDGGEAAFATLLHALETRWAVAQFGPPPSGAEPGGNGAGSDGMTGTAPGGGAAVPGDGATGAVTPP